MNFEEQERDLVPGWTVVVSQDINNYIGAKVLDVFSMIRDEDESCETSLSFSKKIS